MKKFALFFFVGISLFSCKEKSTETTTASIPEAQAEPGEKLYGADFMNVTTLSPDQVNDIYRNLQPGDTVNVTFKAPVKAVCKNKGCWMELEVGGPDPVMVKFKDYEFFVPKDIENKEVTVNGKAFISTVDVEELRHLAKDAGKDEAEINAIDTPERRFSLTADGVRIPDGPNSGT